MSGRTRAWPYLPSQYRLNLSSSAVLGVNAILHAKPDQKQAVWDFLAGGKAIVDDEPDTLQWFAYKIDDTPDGELGAFGIVDTFPDAAGRDAHVGGRIPAALGPKVPELLAKAPALNPIDIIASKISKNAATEGPLPKFIIAYLTAKEDSAAALKKILQVHNSSLASSPWTNLWLRTSMRLRSGRR
jgi:hypothetical protein